MKAIYAILAFVALVFMGCESLRIYLTHSQAEASAARYEAYKVAEDARLSKACDEGRTGIVLYYKGKHCGQ